MNLKVNAKLDPQFQPLSLVCREMREATKENGQDVIIAIERNKGYTVTYKTRIFKDGTGHDEENFAFIERMAKALGNIKNKFEKICVVQKPNKRVFLHFVLHHFYRL